MEAQAYRPQYRHGFQPSSNSFLQHGSAVYGIISTFLFLAIILYACYRSTDASKFPLIGQNLGGFIRRRIYFSNHALELFLEGYEKVLSDGEWLEPFH